MGKQLQDLMASEPVRIINTGLLLVQAMITLWAVAFHIPADVTAATMGLAAALAACVNVFYVRQQVTPVAGSTDNNGNALPQH